MRAKIIGLVARKEILSTLRDTRAIISNLLIPLLLVPAMMVGLPLLLGGLFEREATTLTPLGVEGAANLPGELEAALEAQNVELIPVDDAAKTVRDGEYDVAIVVPEGFFSSVASGGSAELTVVSKVGNMKSELNASKVSQAVSAYTQQVLATRLGDAGLDPSVLQPVTVSVVDASSAAERSSGQLSWLIPFFIAIWTLTGGQMTAIDATAGEKERGTLEVLLVAPVRRSEVVVGKFLATVTFGLSAAFMAIVGLLLGGLVMNAIFLPRLGDDANEIVAVMGGGLSIGLPQVLILLVTAVLLAGLVSALLIGVAMFARSFKEAQSYIAPLSFLFILPAVGLQFKDLIGVGEGAYYVPVLNALLLMDDVVTGGASNVEIAITWASMLVVVVVLLLFALRNFRREEVIFRS